MKVPPFNQAAREIIAGGFFVRSFRPSPRGRIAFAAIRPICEGVPDERNCVLTRAGKQGPGMVKLHRGE